jgi:hypothetical protein
MQIKEFLWILLLPCYEKNNSLTSYQVLRGFKWFTNIYILYMPIILNHPCSAGEEMMNTSITYINELIRIIPLKIETRHGTSLHVTLKVYDVLGLECRQKVDVG